MRKVGVHRKDKYMKEEHHVSKSLYMTMGAWVTKRLDMMAATDFWFHTMIDQLREECQDNITVKCGCRLKGHHTSVIIVARNLQLSMSSAAR